MSSHLHVDPRTVQPQLTSPLLGLPGELIQHILSQLDVNGLLSARLSCKRLYVLSELSHLWKIAFLGRYRYHEQDYRSKDIEDTVGLDWQESFFTRARIDHVIQNALDHVVNHEYDRIAQFTPVIEHGYDAKDYLLIESQKWSNTAASGLARKFWASEMLGVVERWHGLKVWREMVQQAELPAESHDVDQVIHMEYALAVFDLFALDRPVMTLRQLGTYLDSIAARFAEAHPGHESYSTRKKAVELIIFLRDAEIIGHRLEPQNFSAMENNLITVALCSNEHAALPLICCVIYGAVARRLNLNALPCGFPFQVHVVATAPPGYTLDGVPCSPDNEENTRTYLNPFVNTAEVAEATLKSQLSNFGYPPSRHAACLRPMTAHELVERTTRNLLRSLHERPEPADVLSHLCPEAQTLLGYEDASSAQTYVHSRRVDLATLWSAILFTPLEASGESLRLLQDLASDFPYDVTLTAPGFMKDELEMACDPRIFLGVERIRREDQLLPTSQYRSPIPAGKVQYKVGQVFQHKRYSYVGVIHGWDSECKAQEQWIQQMRVDRLPGGRQQCFYKVVGAGVNHERYVAAENVTVLGLKGTPMPDGFERAAGKWFKRWDVDEGVFVSNVKGQYPDD